MKNISTYNIYPVERQRYIWRFMQLPDTERENMFINFVKHLVATKEMEHVMMWIEAAITDPTFEPIFETIKSNDEILEKMYNGCLYYKSTLEQNV